MRTDPNQPHTFQYNHPGMKAALNLAGLKTIPDFPFPLARYNSPNLFPILLNRLNYDKRPDRPQYLLYLGLDEHAHPADILLTSGGHLQTDNYHLFPNPQPAQDGSITGKFFLHHKHSSPATMGAASLLKPSDTLGTNVSPHQLPHQPPTVELKTSQHRTIGLLPPHLARLLSTHDLQYVKVSRTNPGAPISLKTQFEANLTPNTA